MKSPTISVGISASKCMRIAVAILLTVTSCPVVLSYAQNQQAQREYTGKDAWKNKYIERQNEITKRRETMTKAQEGSAAPGTNAFVAASEASGNQSGRNKKPATPARSVVSEYDVQSTERARAQHKSDQELVKEFVQTTVTVLDPKNVSDIFGRRIAKRYVAFQVTVSNENRDYQFLIQDLSMDLSDVAPELEGLKIPSGYAPSSNDLSMLRGVSEKGQVYDWRNLTLRLLQGTGTIAASLGSGVIEVGKAFAPSVATFNGPVTSAFRSVFPDLTVTQANRLNDSAYQANTLVPRQGAKVMVAFVDQSMLMDRDLQKRFYKNPMLIADLIDFRRATAEVKGMLITDVLDQPPLISAVVIGEAQRAHFSDKPATIEGAIVGRNLTGSSIGIDNKGLTIKVKGTPESNRLTFELKSNEPVLPGSVLTFILTRKDDVAKQDFPVSYTIDVPSLDKISPDVVKRGDSDKEITLTGKNYSKGLFSVTACDSIKIKESNWQSPTEIKIKLDVSADAAKGACELHVKNGDNFVSGSKPLTIEKAKEKEKDTPQEN